jgi:type IV secretory pathway VirB10-like protein
VATQDQDDYQPMTDPLRMGDIGARGSDQHEPGAGESAPRAQSPSSSADADHQKIKRGMPRKGILQVLLILVSMGAIALILLPQKSKQVQAQSEIKEQPVQSPTTSNSVVSGLTDGAERERVALEQNAIAASRNMPLPNAQTSGSAISTFTGGSSQNGQVPLTPEEAARVRQETITASSMDATEVQLGTRSSVDASRAAPGPSVGTDSVTLLRESMKQQDKMMRDLMSVDPSKAVPVVSKADPNQEFVQQAGRRDISGFETMQMAPPSPSLLEGTIITAALETGINTDLPGAVRARVTSDVYDSITQSKVLIPRGSVILGRYRSSILVGQSRILVATERLILPNGKSIKLLGSPAADMSGMSGVAADVDNHFWDMFKSSFIIGAASLLLPSDQQQVTVTGTASGGSQTGGSILGTALKDVITRIAERNTSIGPTGTVQPGERITLILSKDVQMEAYTWVR